MVFQVFGFGLLIVFYGFYFYKQLQQKTQEIRTDQMGKGRTGKAKTIELILTIAAILVPIAEIVSMILGITYYPTWIRIIGILIGAVGTAMFIMAASQMGNSWRAGVSATDQTPLITEGIYEVSRNPAFLGFDLLYFGILLMFYNRILFLVSALAAVMFHLQIVNVEEVYLKETHEEEYLRYQARVNRYLGKKKS